MAQAIAKRFTDENKRGLQYGPKPSATPVSRAGSLLGGDDR